jgi:hypothetical protein
MTKNWWKDHQLKLTDSGLTADEFVRYHYERNQQWYGEQPYAQHFVDFQFAVECLCVHCRYGQTGRKEYKPQVKALVCVS